MNKNIDQELIMNSDAEKESTKNFEKLHYVCYEAGPRFLREVFYNYWKVSYGSEWEDGKNCGHKLMSIKTIGNVFRGTKSFQKKILDSGESHRWDFSLLLDILMTLFKGNPSVVLSPYIVSSFTKENVESLKSIRNQIAHAGKIEMDTGTFEPLWKNACNILTSMGMLENQLERPQKQTEDFQTTPIPPIPMEVSENIQKAEKLKTIGNKLFKESAFKEAVAAYSRAIDLEKLPVELLGTLYSNRSVALLKLRDFEGSKDDAKSCITLRPNWFRGYFRLGKAYEMNRKFLKAILNLKIAIHLSDDESKQEAVESLEYCTMMEKKMQRSEHTDPDILKSKELSSSFSLNNNALSKFLGTEQASMFMEGHPLQLCQMGHRFMVGTPECPQNYERAAEYYSKAASMGDAEGLYNLALLTKEGKGVQRDVFRSHELLLEAASKPFVVECVKGSGIKTRNLGVAEACHSLGMEYAFGYIVDVNLKLAEEWYMKAVQYGNGMSANNIACMSQNISKAIDFWKLSAYLGTVRGIENCANMYLDMGQLRLAQEWYHYALHKGSMDFTLLRDKYVRDSELEKSFDPEKFRVSLEAELKSNASSSLVGKVLIQIEENLKDVQGLSAEELREKFMQVDEVLEEGKVGWIIRHRMFLKEVRGTKKQHLKKIAITIPPSHLPTAAGVDLIGLKEIFFKDMEGQKEDTVYEGRVLKLQVIEDAVLGNPSIGLLVEDQNGDVGRMFVYNYPQRKQTHEELGYGCQLSLIYPHYRTMTDGLLALRVDDPQLILKSAHLRNPNRCRYCGKANNKGSGSSSSFPCRKCGRVSYCSKDCLHKDAKELQHSLICFKSLLD